MSKGYECWKCLQKNIVIPLQRIKFQINYSYKPYEVKREKYHEYREKYVLNSLKNTN